jgi:bifunctional UDP-N-acetylglucosamine pyrophosphorylase/glucosamine-1-phosphate N-acetyltransferase
MNWFKNNLSGIKIMGKELSFYDVDFSCPWDLLKIQKDLLKKYLKEKKYSGKNITINGKVYIGQNVTIKENVVINGPTYIGDNSFIGNNTIIRKYSNIGKNALIGANCEIKYSLLGEDVHLHANYVGNSIIGKGGRIGAGTITANTRIDREDVNSFLKKKIDTGCEKLGAILGDNVKTGVNCSLMPGILIGKNCVIGPHSLVLKNIDPNILFYSKFEQIKKER